MTIEESLAGRDESGRFSFAGGRQPAHVLLVVPISQSLNDSWSRPFSGPTGTYVRLVGEVVMIAAIVRCWLTTFESAET